MNSLRNLASRIDEFSIRERGLIMITVLVLLYLLWQAWLMTPLTANRATVSVRISDTKGEVAALNQQTQTIVQRQRTDPDEDNRKEITRLQAQLDGLLDELDEMTAHLIAPDEMAGVLERVLLSSRDVQFISLKGLGVTGLLDSADDDNQTTAAEPVNQQWIAGEFPRCIQTWS